MELKINFDTQAIQTELKQRIQERTSRQIDSQVQELFTRRDRWGETDGVATLIIREEIDQFVLSDQFKEMVRAAIPKAAEGEIANALQKLLGNRIRKHLFQTAESDTNYYTVIEIEGDEHSENWLNSYRTQNRQDAIDFFRRTPGKYSFILVSPTEDAAARLEGSRLDPALYAI